MVIRLLGENHHISPARPHRVELPNFCAELGQTTAMSGPTSSALLLALLGLVSADTAEPPAVPHAPVPEVRETVSAIDQVGSELAKLEQSIRNGLASVAPQTPAPVAHRESADPQPSDTAVSAGPTAEATGPNDNGQAGEHSVDAIVSANPEGDGEPVAEPATRVVLKPLDKTYTRLAPGEISPLAKDQVKALAKAHQPKASGKGGVPVDWLPRESRKALGGNGPRDVVLLAATNEFAWYAWAEADAAWVARINLSDLTQIHAGPLLGSGAFEVPGLQRLIDIPGHPLTVKDVKGHPVPVISR